MREPKRYVNGVAEQSGDFARAKDLLISKGLYRTLGNFGPYFPNKESRIVTHIETFVLEEMEFTIVESEVMSFSFGSMGVSEPYRQKEAWYQPIGS
jgi:hypothetical protein